MMKDANLDAIRTPTFPAVPELYDDTDEMGFYVEDESPFCWVDESADLRYLPTFVQRTAEMIERDRSHPSVIFWSVGNESTWGPDFESAHEFVKKTDPTRPTSAAQSQTLDLATVHNPLTIARIQERKDVKVPIIWDESLCIFQGIWGDARELWRDPGDRDYYIEPLIPAWEALMKSDNVHGSMIWAWVDDAFLVPGRDSEFRARRDHYTFARAGRHLPHAGAWDRGRCSLGCGRWMAPKKTRILARQNADVPGPDQGTGFARVEIRRTRNDHSGEPLRVHRFLRVDLRVVGW
jgi:beta-galactosidase/beta-glucuronidase